VNSLARAFLAATSGMTSPLNVCVELGGMSASSAFGVFYDAVMALITDLSWLYQTFFSGRSQATFCGLSSVAVAAIASAH
jgi:hypothetical protein